MGKYEDEYKRLNAEQKKAVDAVEGPVLVVAGPGTGKTQLLSMRVANIIKRTDTAPSNILCLTFTDNAARNMRERLETIIGQAAYHVAIHTFHSFGSEIINQFPDYFSERQLLQQVDELGRYELLRDIFEELPHSNPLSVKVGDAFIHLKDTLSIIGWLKQNALAPHELHEVINANQQFMEAVEGELAETFAVTPSAKQLGAYKKFLETVQKHATGQRFFGFPEYATECAAELEQAIAETDSAGRYAPKITAWRNAWCQKDAHNRHVFKDAGRAMRKMHALANVYQQLLDSMAEQGLYDFDDMIIEAVHALETHDDLRYSLQERFQYVLVDEFQDTNKAQLRMLSALGDNPVHEGRPNIMAVGDDDQAIYAFQGAEVSNMVAFARQYKIDKPIALGDNYRSTAGILEAGFSVAGQITDRLESVLSDAHKQLVAKAEHPAETLRHSVFPSELAQYDWVAGEVKKLVDGGTKPEEIAIIAPRHKYLERLMPYLGSRRLPVAYERRENILEAPLIAQLITMARLVVAIADNRQGDVDELVSQVLGYDFWDIPAEELLQISLGCYNAHKHWLEVLNKHKNKRPREITAWFVDLAKHSPLEPLEYMLDRLIGAAEDGADSEYDDLMLPRLKTKFVSPLRAFYFNPERYEQATDDYLTLLGQLSTLRQRLRQWKPNRLLLVKDLVEFAELHLSAGLKIVDTNPHTQTTNAVQVMTAYKAKGLEFDAVFVINAQDEVWGPTARSRSPNITLPKNLPIAPASDGDNDKLRLLFVALTRAKHSLHVTSYTHDLANKLSPGLSFISDAASAGLKPQAIDKPATPQAVEILSTDWSYRFRQVIADKPTLFEPILANYKLSVTHLNNFIDVREGGPQYFFMHNLLRFPEAPTPSAAYGDAVHKTLQWAHTELRKGQLPTTKKLQDYFADILDRKHLKKPDHKKLDRRGREALALYFKHRGGELSAQDIVERGFNNEGVVIGGASLSGKIDKLHFSDQGSVEVVDFKTGKPALSWQGKDEFEKVKLYKYRQQLLFYKLLVEHSASFGGKLAVSGGALEFIEADDRGQLVNNLELEFDQKEIDQFMRLIGAVWAHITKLDFPDVSHYPKNLRGIKQFEQDLIDGNI
ncbi:MAG TPA: ATP-dependent DNA helicase [Candidatus Dormibacteraeota bacterium]|nr:ATP-dependent DNA helicase [Candidatus Dormibacteraeota bacterium]